MSPQVGTLTSSGLYTAPASITQNTLVSVTAAVGSKSAAGTVSLVPPSSGGFSASITVSGSAVVAKWTAPANHTASDWIALTSIDAPAWWTIWTKSTGGALNGSVSIPLPKTPGIYEFRYFINGGYTLAGRSNSLAIANSGYGISTSTSPIKAGTTLTISYTAGANRTPTDYIGLYKVGSDSGSPVTFNQTKGAASGTMSFVLPAGTYELRYIMGSSSYTYICAALTNPITSQ